MLIDLKEIRYDNKQLENLKEKEFDYIIIGSGPAGVTLCNEILKKSKKRILIIERGNFSENKLLRIFYKFLPVKLESRVFAVGGTSNTWSNISSSFDESEMKQRWTKKNTNLWPLSYSELKKFYNKIDKNFGFNYEEKNNGINIPFKIRKFYGLNKATNFKNHILYKKISLLYNCQILTIDEIHGKSFVSFKFQDNLSRIYAKKIIISSGGIESTVLVLRSLKEKKLKNIMNKKFVGCYFMDHPKLYLGYLKYPKMNLIKKLIIKKNENKFSYFGVSLKNNLKKNKKMLNTYVRFENETFYFNYKRKYLILFHLLKLLFCRIFNIKKTQFKIRLRAFCEMVPRKNNKISLSNDTQKIFINYKLCSTSIKTLKCLSSNISQYFSYRPEKESIHKIDRNFIYKNIEDASHHMGGLAYSKNKNKSIVDKNLKIIGTNNIYVCSAAVFPTSGSVNPTMTLCALAVRLASHLLVK